MATNRFNYQDQKVGQPKPDTISNFGKVCQRLEMWSSFFNLNITNLIRIKQVVMQQEMNKTRE